MFRNLFAYIEGYYNRQRLHSALGYITPEQAERRIKSGEGHVLRTPSRGRCAVERAVAVEDQAGLREGTVSDRAVSFARETMQYEFYAPVANRPDFTPPHRRFFLRRSHP
jgi:hypothetical protein